MADDTKIEPALSAEEWARAMSPGRPVFVGTPNAISDAIGDRILDNYGHFEGLSDGDAPALIALANAALPDDDPRKITHQMIDDIRESMDYIEVERHIETIGRIADALESYLPPRAT